MKPYIISASDLLDMAKSIVEDGMDYVAVSFMEEDLTDPDMPIPPGIHFECFTKESPEVMICYDEIDVVDDL